MENGIKMIIVSKWFLISIKYIDSKITICPPEDISLIYLCWVTNVKSGLQLHVCQICLDSPSGNLAVTEVRPVDQILESWSWEKNSKW